MSKGVIFGVTATGQVKPIRVTDDGKLKTTVATGGGN